MKFYVVHDPKTGVVKQTGMCGDRDFAGNTALHAADGFELLEHTCLAKPNEVVVDLATKKIVSKPAPVVKPGS